VHYRIQYKLAVFTFKALTTQQPHYLDELIRARNPATQLRFSGQMMLHNDRTKLSFADRAFFTLILHYRIVCLNLLLVTYPLVLLH
jgi:hypothetical protein